MPCIPALGKAWVLVFHRLGQAIFETNFAPEMVSVRIKTEIQAIYQKLKDLFQPKPQPKKNDHQQAIYLNIHPMAFGHVQTAAATRPFEVKLL